MKKRLTILFGALALLCSMAMASTILPADVNGDGKVSNDDAALIYAYICDTAIDTITADDVDVNGDGKVNTADVVEVYLNSIPYLTFTADKEQTMTVTLKGSYVLDESLQYSVKGGPWTQLTASKPIYFGGENGTLRLRGKSATGTAATISKYALISFNNKTVSVACSGDIRTLVNYSNYASAYTDEALFCYLFSGCTNLTSAPQLPSKSLADKCYYGRPL